ncbi:MAG: hypothetical protein R3B09_02730 [Nannocystaceae bacterium]
MRPTRSRLVVVVIVASLVSVGGCAGKLEGAARAQAAADFRCDAAAIELRGDDVHGKFHASGCGQQGTYSAECLAGKCSAERLRGE